MKFVYLSVDLGAMLVPFIFSFHPKIGFNRHFRAAFTAIGIVALVFMLWDICFTALGVWGFNSKYITGYHIVNLPVEEVMFFVCIPFSSLFTYHTLKNTVFKSTRILYGHTASVFIGIALLVLSLIFSDHYYTVSTFFLCGTTLIAFAAFAKNVSSFLLSYLVLLIPFFITNGILTGTGLQQPVVWYNNMENLGLRILTIPVEDVFYGMLLILLNAILFEFFLNKNKQSNVAS